MFVLKTIGGLALGATFALGAMTTQGAATSVEPAFCPCCDCSVCDCASCDCCCCGPAVCDC